MACWAAPRAGVLVTAPEKIPAIVVIDTTAPAALDVIVLARGDGYGLLMPTVEVLARDVSPVQTRHVGAVGIFLEKDVELAVAVGHAVGLVGPAARRHAVELRAP